MERATERMIVPLRALFYNFRTILTHSLASFRDFIGLTFSAKSLIYLMVYMFPYSMFHTTH